MAIGKLEKYFKILQTLNLKSELLIFTDERLQSILKDLF